MHATDKQSQSVLVVNLQLPNRNLGTRPMPERYLLFIAIKRILLPSVTAGPVRTVQVPPATIVASRRTKMTTQCWCWGWCSYLHEQDALQASNRDPGFTCTLNGQVKELAHGELSDAEQRHGREHLSRGTSKTKMIQGDGVMRSNHLPANFLVPAASRVGNRLPIDQSTRRCPSCLGSNSFRSMW